MTFPFLPQHFEDRREPKPAVPNPIPGKTVINPHEISVKIGLVTCYRMAGGWGMHEDLLGLNQFIHEHCVALLADDSLNDDQRTAIGIVQGATLAFEKNIASTANHLQLMRTGQGYFNISHELRDPLVSMIGFPKLFLIGAFGILSGQQQDCFEKIHSAAQQLNTVIDEAFQRSSSFAQDQSSEV